MVGWQRAFMFTAQHIVEEMEMLRRLGAPARTADAYAADSVDTEGDADGDGDSGRRAAPKKMQMQTHPMPIHDGRRSRLAILPRSPPPLRSRSYRHVPPLTPPPLFPPSYTLNAAASYRYPPAPSLLTRTPS